MLRGRRHSSRWAADAIASKTKGGTTTALLILQLNLKPIDDTAPLLSHPALRGGMIQVDTVRMRGSGGDC